ncbi:MAG: type II secretion system GspH family protein [Gammaproteobacteria bacterium]|nr:type II secretion system GspH family protein [Gammaproteobacteria bacterium]
MKRQGGFTLTEILVALALSAIVFSAVTSLLSTNRRVAIQETMDSRLQSNVRLAISELTRSVRNAGYGVPETNLSTWVPWVAGFTANPMLVQGAGTDPDQITIAHCTLSDLTTLSADAAQGDTTITVTSAAGIDTGPRRFLTLDTDEYVHVVSVSGNLLDIDTDLLTGGQQGLSKARPSGTPICRVDVKTYDVDTAVDTIRVNNNDGVGPMVVADEIIDLQIAVGGTGNHYTLTISGESQDLDPVTGSPMARTVATSVSPRN